MMKVGALIFCLLGIDACRGPPRAPPQQPIDNQRQEKNDVTDKGPCAKYEYGVCPVEVDSDKNSNDANVDERGTDDSKTTMTSAVAKFVNATNSYQKMAVKVTIDGQEIAEEKISLSKLTITTQQQQEPVAAGTNYSLSLTVSADANKNNTDYCAKGVLTSFSANTDLTVTEGVCQ